MAEAPLIVEALARKYRPRKFRDIVGQESTVAQLRGMLKQNKVPGFLLLVGPSGCGKTKLARLLARYVNCERGIACGKCASCLHDPDNHPDVYETNAASERGIDDIRGLLEHARFMPRYRLKMMILDEAHNLTPQAQQAFLKPLEDNPSTTMYVVCTTDPEKMPTAMLTRARTLAVKMPTPDAVIARLQVIADSEDVKVSPTLLQGITEFSGGSMRAAINLLEGAATLLADNPKADTKTVLIDLGVSASPGNQVAAMKIVISMHKGLRKALIRSVYDVQDPVPVMNLALRYNEYLMGVTCITEKHPGLWHTADNREFHTRFREAVEKPSLETAAVVQRKLMAARNLLVSSSTSSRSLLFGTLL